jgi:hypothetical protein
MAMHADAWSAPSVAPALPVFPVVIDIDPARDCWRQLGTAPSDLVFLFHEWEPAVRVGIHAFLAYPGRDFDSIEPHIVAEAYRRVRGASRIPWSRAAPTARRMWQKLHDEQARADAC